MRFLATVFILLVLTTFANANEVVLTAPSGHFATLIHDDSGYTVEIFQNAADGWQDRIARKNFPNEKLLKAFLKQSKFSRANPKAEIKIGQNARVAAGVIWKVTQQWDWNWEKQFAEWVNKEADPEFFVRHSFATDCADVAFSLRWIFARMHGLPAVSQLAGSRRYFSQDDLRPGWENLATAENWFEDKRFLKALSYLTDNVYTHTLRVDSYPIAINTESLLAGTFYLTINTTSGHTLFVHRTFYNDRLALPLKLMNSTVPKDIRPLQETDFWESVQPEAGTGFRRFRWPLKTSSGWSLVKEVEMPNYSLEQHDKELMNGSDSFSLAVYKKLNPGFSFTSWAKAGITDIGVQLSDREQIVKDGYARCSSAGACEPDSSDYENWSTPSRDKRLKNLIEMIASVASNSKDVKPLWEEALNSTVVKLDGIPFTLKALMTVWSLGLYETDPRISPARRWGLQPVALADNLAAKAERLLKEREAKISAQGNECRQPVCRMSDPSFKKWLTAKEDIELVRLRAVSSAYCSSVSYELCEELKNSGDRILPEITGKKLGLSEWLELAIWFVADPRVSPETRWGGQRLKHRHKIFPGDAPAAISKGGWAIIGDKISSLITNQVVAPPANHSWKKLVVNGDWGIAVADDKSKLTFVRLSTGKQLSFEIGLDSAIDIVGDDFLVVRADFDMTVFRIGEDVEKIGFYEGAIHLVNSNVPNILMAYDSAGEFKFILDARKTIQRYTLPSPLVSMNVVADIDGKFLLSSYTDNDYVTHLFDPEKNTLRELPHLKGAAAVFWKSKHFVVRSYGTPNKIWLVKVDDAFNEVNRMMLGEWLNITKPIACFYTNNEKPKCFKVDDDSFYETPIFTDRFLENWNDKFMSFKDGVNPNAYLARIEQPNTKLAEGAYFSFGADRSRIIYASIDSTSSVYNFIDTSQPDLPIVFCSQSGGYSSGMHIGRGTFMYLENGSLWFERL